jgi:23S rRNA (cytidine2498-2'-O)-methyltransferase
MSKFIFTCRNGYEEYLEHELINKKFTPEIKSGGMVLCSFSGKYLPEINSYCFPHFAMLEPIEISGDSVNKLSLAIAEKFFSLNQNTEFKTDWPFIILENLSLNGIGKRESAVREQTLEYLRRIAGRISKLAASKLPNSFGRHNGLVLYFEDFNKVYFSTEFVWFGQIRVSDDESAPSRSYLKVEEAYRVMGSEPKQGETVCDLGAAPGGWSYSAAKRGAKVTAVDNGELKSGAKNNPNIIRLPQDAFKYEPSKPFNWLFCDMVEHPYDVLKLLEYWIQRKWCRNFIVNLKFGRVKPKELLDKINSQGSVVKTRTLSLNVRHLYHDRDEVTITGKLE